MARRPLAFEFEFRKESCSGTITPYQACVLYLLRNSLEKANKEFSSFTSLEKRLLSCLVLNLVTSSDKPLASVLELYNHISRKNRHLDTSLQDLLRKVAAYDLDLFLDSLNRTVYVVLNHSSIEVKRSSLVGQFVRRFSLSMKKLSFGEVIELWKNFKTYCSVEVDSKLDLLAMREHSSEVPRTSSPLAGNTWKRNLFRIIDDKSCDIASMENMSRTEAGFYLKKQIYLIQMNPGRAAPPMEINRWVATMLEKHPNFYQLHFLKFVNALRLQDFASAETALFDYFDWAMIDSSLKSAPEHGVNAANWLRCCAPLLLSKLYRHFGCREKTYDHLEECVQKAQEANNSVCLKHAVTELCILQDPEKAEKPEGFSLFDLSLEDKEDRTNPELSFFSNMAKIYLDYRRGKNIKKIIESLHNVLCTVVGKDTIKWTVRNEVTSFAMASISSLFLETGHYAQCCLESLMILYSMHDEYFPFCGIACESISIALCNVIYCMYAKGYTAAAMQLLKYAKAELPSYLAESTPWKACEASIGFEIAFLHGQFGSCETWLEKLMAVSANEALIRKSALQIAMRNVTDAMDVIEKLRRQKLTPGFHCRTLIQLAECYLEVLENLNVALEVLTRCISFAQEQSLYNIAAMAERRIAEIYLIMGLKHEALKNAEKATAVLSIYGSRHEYARCLLTFAQCLILTSDWNTSGNVDGLKRALGYLTQALAIFVVADSPFYEKQLLLLMAYIYNALRDRDERNQTSNMFQRVSSKCSTPDLSHLVKYTCDLCKKYLLPNVN